MDWLVAGARRHDRNLAGVVLAAAFLVQVVDVRAEVIFLSWRQTPALARRSRHFQSEKRMEWRSTQSDNSENLNSVRGEPVEPQVNDAGSISYVHALR